MAALAIDEMFRGDRVWNEEKFIKITRQYGKDQPNIPDDLYQEVFDTSIRPLVKEWL